MGPMICRPGRPVTTSNLNAYGISTTIVANIVVGIVAGLIVVYLAYHFGRN